MNAYSKKAHIAIYLSHLTEGGIGRVIANLIREFVKRDHRVDLLVARTDGPYLALLPDAVRVIKVPTSHPITSVPFLARYLRRERPDVLLTERIRTNVSALRARRLARVATRVYTGVHTNLSTDLVSRLSKKKQKTHFSYYQRFTHKNDGVIAVSQGVADDLVDNFSVSRDRVHVIYNPVVTPELSVQAQVDVKHPWLAAKEIAVILGIGRLTKPKNFPLLLRAFDQVREQCSCRLLVLGEGELRPELARLIAELGLSDDVELLGFVKNPYAYMAKADLFVLSSMWEGFSNVLAEALAVGLPVVSTDCPSGPSEILENGRYGKLTPVNDADALAKAMLETLRQQPNRAELRAAAVRFRVDVCADQYLQALGLAGVDAEVERRHILSHERVVSESECRFKS